MNVTFLFNVLHMLSNAPINFSEEKTPQQDNFFEKYHADGNLCYRHLGCFPTDTPPWKTSSRISVAPESIDQINPKLCLYKSPTNPCQDVDIMDNIAVKTMIPRSTEGIVVITHGFVHSGDRQWVKKLARLIILKGRKNTLILSADWKLGAHPPYAQAVANTRIVGAYIGFCLKKISTLTGINIRNTHLIGHSLGSHIIGYVGKYLQNYGIKVGRITGLDPAGPYFTDVSPLVRLDSTDAHLVVNIHTDSKAKNAYFAETLGLAEAVGHVDFYPDGGTKQRSCNNNLLNNSPNDGLEGTVNYISCNHRRAIQYIAASMYERCQFIGVECSSWEEFIKGKCMECINHRCFQMGFHFGMVPTKYRKDFFNNTSNIKAYMVTRKDGRFCGNQVLISIHKPIEYDSLQLVKFFLTIRGSKETIRVESPKLETYNATVLEWVTSIKEIGKIRSVVWRFKETMGIFRQFLNADSKEIRIFKITFKFLLEPKIYTFAFCKEHANPDENYVLIKKSCT